MGRVAKQFLYGVLYLAIAALIVWFGYIRFLKPIASCTDGIQDQGEQGIDCGGPCRNICTAGLQPIEILGTPPPSTFPNSGGHVTFLTAIENPNQGAGVENLNYTYVLSNASGAVVQTIPKSTFIYPGQDKIIVDANLPAVGFVSADLVIATSVPWIASSSMGSIPILRFQNVAIATQSSSTMVESGLLLNGEPTTMNNVQIVGLFEDSGGNVIGASITQVLSVPAGTTAEVSVTYPYDPRVDLTKTQMYADALR